MLTSVQSDWIWPLSLIGVFFYPLFRLTALCSQELGISVATIATKLSMAIPVLVLALADGIFDIAWGQWLGLGLAFPAVWLSAKAGESEETREQTSASSAFWWMPVVMFVAVHALTLCSVGTPRTRAWMRQACKWRSRRCHLPSEVWWAWRTRFNFALACPREKT